MYHEGVTETSEERGPDQTAAEVQATAFDESDGADGGWSDEEVSPAPAGIQSIGRFVVLKKLGAGAMGVVYAAYDADLDRKVAVKLLKVGTEGKKDRRARLYREAQALAKLSHPNVVQVYEVGTHDHQVFVAMEFLNGETLRDWQRVDEPDMQSLLEVYVQAGRGLEAAHRAGLVHRDFKPDNALIEGDGRVRVLDFGLARASDDEESSVLSTEPELEEQLGKLSASSSGSRPGDLHSPDGLTMTGAMMGTPAYMSPEQFTGEAATPASDQFAFCVTLWEALYGKRPFAGGDALTLAFNVKQGKLREPPRDATVPGWLHRVLARGLSVEPDDRWPSMSALLDELTRDRGRNRRAVWLTAGVAGLATALGVASLSGDEPNVCSDMQAALEGAWDDSRKTEVRTAFEASGVPYASDVLARVEARFDDYADEWVHSRTDACEATHVRGEQSQHLLDLRMGCLDRRRAGLAAMVETFADADAAVVERAPSAIAGLLPVAPCDDRERLMARVPPPDDPIVAGRVDDIRERLERARAIGEAGRYQQAVAEMEDLAEESEDVDYPPLRAELLAERGHARKAVGRLDEAEADFAESFSIALTAGDDETAANAAGASCNLIGYLQQRYDEALVWGRAARLSLAARARTPCSSRACSTRWVACCSAKASTIRPCPTTSAPSSWSARFTRTTPARSPAP